MSEEDKIYIEVYLTKLVLLTVEIGYCVDKFGNIVYKDKENTINEIDQLIERESKEMKVSQEEIRDFLVNYYRKISINPKAEKESTEIIGLLDNTTVNDHKKRKNKNSDKLH